jgi:glycosyltransferase involved in cell wall biosynthesis
VRSALEYAGDIVEVIVVPNGPDRSYEQSLAEFSSDARVRVHPIEVAHGNVARNHGMQLAQGKYLRFLDDDDYLLSAALHQLRHMENSSAEVCSGLLLNLDQSGTELGTVGFPNTVDFVCAALTISGFTLPTGNVFLRSALKGCLWAPEVNRGQDLCWMLDLAAKREWSWTHFPQQVGVWFQHDTPRVSSTSALRGTEQEIIHRIFGIYKSLSAERRIDDARRDYIASCLWYYIHRGFPYHPFYWTRIARLASHIFPAARPAADMFRRGVFGRTDPLVGEWVLLPARLLTQASRRLITYVRGPTYRRRL